MSPNLIDAYRALAGVAGSEKIDTDIKREAVILMKKCMQVMDKAIKQEDKQLTDYLAHVNSGIIS